LPHDKPIDRRATGLGKTRARQAATARPDQCRLYNKQDLPWAFCTWAFVNDAVHERLRSSTPVIAPHEWKCGEHAWLIDVVAPFGDAETIAAEACAQFAAGRTVHAWMPKGGNMPTLRTFAPEAKSG
jgi:cytolysin-activating lysine-acyltransferase